MLGTEIVEVDESDVAAVASGRVGAEELKPLEVDIGSIGVSAGVADDVELERDVAVESESAELGGPGTEALYCGM
jgi:hypothetical protein